MTVPDRSGWAAGPWDGEPDRLEWSRHGVPCLMIRHGNGHWCGYVGVLEGHPWYGLSWEDLDAVKVHGGVTFGRAQTWPADSRAPWWIGFDCAHPGDLAPSYSPVVQGCDMVMSRWGMKRSTAKEGLPVGYRDVAYVRAETERLARAAARRYRR